LLKDIKDTVSSLKRGGTGLNICPKCGSTDVTTITRWLSPPLYECNSCGFRNIIFFEVSNNEEDSAQGAAERE